MAVSISIILDNRRPKKFNKFPIKLLVVNDRIPKMYQTIYDLTQKEFDNLSASRISDSLQKIRDNIKLIKRESETIAQNINPFEFDDFQKEYILNNSFFQQRKYIKTTIKQNKVSAEFDYSEYIKRFPIIGNAFEIGTIGYTYIEYIKSLLRMGRIGTAANYQSNFLSLNKFGGNVQFTHITVEYLHQYESWMKSSVKSKTTVGVFTYDR